VPDPDVIQVTAHPAERRRMRSGAPAQAGQCCCCCCCLHTIGGLIGAAVGPTVGPMRRRDLARTAEAADYDDEFWDARQGRPLPPRAGVSAVAVYWLSVLALCGIGGGIALLQTVAGEADAPLVWGFGLVLFFPAVQLAAALPPAVYLLISRRPDRWIEFGQLGRIVAGLVLGTIIGILAMVAIGVVLRAL
jgi:hypothetical protein